MFTRLLMVAAMLSGLTMMAPSTAKAGDTCAFVMGTLNGRTFTTPAVMIPVPDTIVGVGQGQIHVDETTQEILGYSISVPGLTGTSIPQNVFIPGFEIEIPSYALTLADISAVSYTCVSFGVTTPAIPVNVPASKINIPGYYVTVPAIDLTLAGKHISVPGKTLQVGGNTIVIPAYSNTIQPVTVATPDETVTVNLNGSLREGDLLRTE